MMTGLLEYFGDSVSRYDRRLFLVPTEAEALTSLFSGTNRKRNEGRALKDLESLQRPLWTFAGCANLRRNQATQFVRIICRSIFEQQTTYWSWDSATWATVATKNRSLTQDIAVFAYIACGIDVFDIVYSDRIWGRNIVASRIFGSEIIEGSLQDVAHGLRAAGYRVSGARVRLRTIMATAFLHERHADLRRLGSDTIEYLRGKRAIREHPTLRRASVSFAYALAQLGIIDSPPADLSSPDRPNKDYDMTSNVPDKWLQVARRWKSTSTLSPGTRSTIYGLLLRIGRWIGHEHPDKANPADWTRTTVAEFIAMVDRMRTGDHLERVPVNLKCIGKPIEPAHKITWIKACRTFFRDCNDWDWFPRRFTPSVALAVPRSIRGLVGPDPRVIADDIWAKLMWSGLNLSIEDIPVRATGSTMYPFEMTRAIVLLWLLSGLRSDELFRLPVGAVRWGVSKTTIDLITQTVEGSANAVCFLDVPLNKTSPPFTKPIERIVGEAIESWETLRPAQRPIVDRKTGDYKDFLFQFRGRRVSPQHLNQVVIPLLCRKAGVPGSDARGSITSHRARATIASQLYNAKDPMPPYDVMTWLGHKSLQSTLHYLKVTPNRLAKSYADANYFRRNLRTINVLLDRDAVKSGAAARGEPWRYYDLGHGYCANDFFSQCAHRMACARCSFYVPKQSQLASLLESRASNERLVQEIPLTDEERAAVDGDTKAVNRLIEVLAPIPALDGQLRSTATSAVKST